MMDLGLANVNWVSIVAAAAVNMVLGTLWYSPVLFGKQWAKLTGKTDMKGGGMGYGVAAAGALVMAFVLNYVVGLSGASDAVSGALVGLMVAVGFVVTSFASGYVFEGRPRDLYLLNAGYYVVGLTLMGVVLVLL